MNFSSYSPNNYFDEYFIQDDVPRDAANLLVNTINNLEKGDLKKGRKQAKFL